MARDKIKSSTDQRHYSLIYHDSLDSDKLDGVYEKVLFVALKRFADANGQCFPSTRTLARITGMSRSCVVEKLEALERKGIIKSEKRTRPDGGCTSNIYTLYDYAEMWTPNNDMDEVTPDDNQRDTIRMINMLRAQGYTVTKEKEPDATVPAKVTVKSDPELLEQQLDIVDNSRNSKNCQAPEEYSQDEIRKYYNYDVLVNDNPKSKQDIDAIMSILYDTLNGKKPTIRIDGEDKPRMVVVSRLLKIGYMDIRYAIRKYTEQTDRIVNPRAYMLTILYHAVEQGHLDVTNQVTHDMTGNSVNLQN